MTSKLVITEQTLTGWVAEVSANKTCGAAVIAQAIPDPQHPTPTPTWLVSFMLDGSNLQTAIQPTPAYDLRGLLWLPDGRLLVGDKRGPPFVVHTFTAADTTCTLTETASISVPTMPVLALTN
jgi:hypothetical protein